MDNRELFADENAREQNRMSRELDDDKHNNLTRTERFHPAESLMQVSHVTNTSCESYSIPLTDSGKTTSESKENEQFNRERKTFKTDQTILSQQSHGT